MHASYAYEKYSHHRTDSEETATIPHSIFVYIFAAWRYAISSLLSKRKNLSKNILRRKYSLLLLVITVCHKLLSKT